MEAGERQNSRCLMAARVEGIYVGGVYSTEITALLSYRGIQHSDDNLALLQMHSLDDWGEKTKKQNPSSPLPREEVGEYEHSKKHFGTLSSSMI